MAILNVALQSHTVNDKQTHLALCQQLVVLPRAVAQQPLPELLLHHAHGLLRLGGLLRGGEGRGIVAAGAGLACELS